MSMSYKIRVKTLIGDILTFHNVVTFKSHNGFVVFVDCKTNKEKIFSVSSCEIEREE